MYDYSVLDEQSPTVVDSIIYPVVADVYPRPIQCGQVTLVDVGWQGSDWHNKPIGLPVPTIKEARELVLNNLDPDYLEWERNETLKETTLSEEVPIESIELVPEEIGINHDDIQEEEEQQEDLEEDGPYIDDNEIPVQPGFHLKSSCTYLKSMYNGGVDSDTCWKQEQQETVNTEQHMDTKNAKSEVKGAAAKAAEVGKKAETKAAEAPKKEAAKTPTLTCKITGRTRPTTDQYLNDKAARLRCTVDELHQNYVCKDAAKLLRAGKTIEEIRNALNVPAEVKMPSKAAIERFLKMNGKTKRSGADSAAPAAAAEAPAASKAPAMATA